MKKKEVARVILFLLVIYISYHFFMDWDSFKDGLMGIP